MSTAIFNGISRHYDAVNRVLSLGMDPGWRDRVRSCLPQRQGLKVLDLATGTGDMAISLAKDVRVQEVVGIDLAEGMLRIAQDKVAREGLSGKIRFLKGDALAVAFQDSSFDVVSVAFGVRNYAALMTGLLEARRVLKDDGCLIILEFSLPGNGLYKYLHAFYLKFVVPFAGCFLTRDLEAYQHLSRTVLAFPCAERFTRIIRQIGFRNVEHIELAMGAVTVYVAYMRN